MWVVRKRHGILVKRIKNRSAGSLSVVWFHGRALLKECKSPTVQNGIFDLPVTQILIIVINH